MESQANQNHQAKGPKSGLAIAAMVIGIIAAVLSPLPIINNLAFIIAAVALVLGIIAFVGIRKKGLGGKGMAIAGIVLGVVSLVVVLGTQAMYGAALDSVSEAISGGSSASAESTAPESEPAASDESAERKYEVTIDSCNVVDDYEGNPAASITYTWTNNSDEAVSFASAVYPKCFQNGVQLESAIVTSTDSSNYLNEVKPGSTVEVTLDYELQDKSELLVEVKEFISFNDDLLATKTFTLE